MTIAVCFKCGAAKWGAFNSCDQCGASPHSEDDLALSMLLSDHYFDETGRKELSAAIAAGNPPRLDEETRRKVILALRKIGMFPRAQKATDICDEAPPRKRAWWKKVLRAPCAFFMFGKHSPKGKPHDRPKQP